MSNKEDFILKSWAKAAREWSVGPLQFLGRHHTPVTAVVSGLVTLPWLSLHEAIFVGAAAAFVESFTRGFSALVPNEESSYSINEEPNLKFPKIRYAVIAALTYGAFNVVQAINSIDKSEALDLANQVRASFRDGSYDPNKTLFLKNDKTPYTVKLTALKPAGGANHPVPYLQATAYHSERVSEFFDSKNKPDSEKPLTTTSDDFYIALRPEDKITVPTKVLESLKK